MIDNVPAEKLSLILESTEYARNVQHTNIAQVYNIYNYSSKFRNVLYIVMKLYPHGNLEEFIQVHSPLCQTTILHFVHEIIRGMKYLHARSTPFLHRDISTDNIFLSKSNSTFQNLVIGDFDLGREIVSGADTKVGKDVYAPPEMNQLERTYGIKADVWSLGVVALQLMSGGKFAKKTGMNRPLAIEMVYNTEATVKKIRDLLSVSHTIIYLC
jgi:serine/threonine-protein kinase 24/25/MST4